jgi:hypothetical protein
MPGNDKLEIVRLYWEHARSLLPTWGLPMLFVWAFLFGGVITLAYGAVSSMEAFYSSSWPSVEGVITLSQIDTFLSESDTGSTTMYHPQVSYNFRVDGTVYQSDLINLGDYSTTNLQWAQKWLSPYPIGKTVSVFYDPGRPEKAVLEPGPTGGLLIPLFVGVIVTTVGVFLLVLLLRKMFAGFSPSEEG